MSQKKLTTKDKLKSINEMLENSLEDIFLNNEKFKRYLDVMAKFPSYSINNLALIYSQKPDASMIQGFKQWNSIGRYVKSGEKSLTINAPIFKNIPEVIKDKDGNEVLDESGKKQYTLKKTLTGYMPVNVFDVSQTTGKEIPKTSDFVKDIRSGDENVNYEKLYELIKEGIVNNAKVPVNDTDLTAYLKERPSVYGYYTHNTNSIVIRNSLNTEQKLTTLIHEFAHSQLHSKTSPFAGASKKDKEIHAEAVAYSISKYYGLDTSQFSVGYIATWSKDLEQAKKGLQDIKDMVNQTVRSIDNIIYKNQSQLEVFKENNQPDHLFEKQAIEAVGEKNTRDSQNDNKSVIDIQSLFTRSVPKESVDNFQENMMDEKNQPIFEILDKQTLTFITGQFVGVNNNHEYEFQIHGGKTLTNKEFESGDYLVTNLLSKGDNINLTTSFEEQFFINTKTNENNQTEYSISVHLMNGDTLDFGVNENIENKENINFVKSQYNLMALDKTENHSFFMENMMKRLDLVVDKDIRDQLNINYHTMSENIHQENLNTLNRHFEGVNITNDKNTVMLLTEFVKSNPTIRNFDELDNNLDGASKNASERMGMNKDLYKMMLLNAVNQVIDHSLSKENLYEQVNSKSIVLSREPYAEKVYLESLEKLEGYFGNKNYDNVASEKLNHLLELNDLNGQVRVSNFKKVTSTNEVNAYEFDVQKGNSSKKVVISDEKEMLPYKYYNDKNIDLKDLLKGTSGVNHLSLEARENDAVNEIDNDKKKEMENEDLVM
ncbi:ArdC family protein [Bacillus safensis]|uniref:N-terminal domain-containing protein n=1 Tax=Bacillus safensis TaxID=561879 RepID=A0A1L6ZPC0_BACIA|nr:ArdC family protein [Bacillus safensis]APT48358.1 hypothetical protein BSA145_21070 [Bacillus safensis]